MRRFFPAFVVSILLHAGVFLLALLTWVATPKAIPIPSVPVEIVSSVPQHEAAAAPVDTMAVKPPEPVPAPPEPVKPTPPVPAPPQPLPEPIKPVKTPEKVVTKAPPDKNGIKKPVPEKPTLDLNALAQIGAAPSKAKTRQQAQANVHPTNGSSNTGAAPNDAGQKVALDALADRIKKLWTLNCDVPGSDQVVATVTFTLSPNGRVIMGPTWVNRRDDPVWEAAAGLAIAAVNKGQPYADLPGGLYGQPIKLNFDAKTACRDR